MKTVIEMAREAGAIPIHKDYKQQALVGNENIERFAELVRAEEREACVKAIQKIGQHGIITQCVAAIRARSNT